MCGQEGFCLTATADAVQKYKHDRKPPNTKVPGCAPTAAAGPTQTVTEGPAPMAGPTHAMSAGPAPTGVDGDVGGPTPPAPCSRKETPMAPRARRLRPRRILTCSNGMRLTYGGIIIVLLYFY